MRKITVECKSTNPSESQHVKFVSTSQLHIDQEFQVVIGDQSWTLSVEDLLTFARAISPSK